MEESQSRPPGQPARFLQGLQSDGSCRPRESPSSSQSCWCSQPVIPSETPPSLPPGWSGCSWRFRSTSRGRLLHQHTPAIITLHYQQLLPAGQLNQRSDVVRLVFFSIKVVHVPGYHHLHQLSEVSVFPLFTDHVHVLFFQLVDG